MAVPSASSAASSTASSAAAASMSPVPPQVQQPGPRTVAAAGPKTQPKTQPKPQQQPQPQHAPLPAGIIRALWSSEREQLTAHLLRLSDDDLHRRFHGAISAGQLEDHVDEAFAPHRHVIGFFQNHVLRGAVELDENGPAVEAAVTVEKDLRNQGVGHALLSRALERAGARGHKALVVHTTRTNGPMVGLAQSLDASMEHDGPDVSGLIPVKRAQPMKLLFDLAMDEAKLAAMVLSAHRRFWTGGKG